METKAVAYSDQQGKAFLADTGCARRFTFLENVSAGKLARLPPVVRRRHHSPRPSWVTPGPGLSSDLSLIIATIESTSPPNGNAGQFLIN